MENLKYTQSIYGILAILSSGPQSGYDIRKALDNPEMYYWRESYGNIYPMLKKLYQDGLVDKTDSFVKKKKRLIYRLNQNGWLELHKWMKEPANLNRFRVELLMKLRFGACCGVENMIAQLTHYRKQSEDQLIEAEMLLGQLASSEETLINDLRRITISLFAERKKSALIWCSTSSDLLEKWKLIEEQTKSNQNAELSAEILYSEMLLPETADTSPMPPRIIPLME